MRRACIIDPRAAVAPLLVILVVVAGCGPSDAPGDVGSAARPAPTEPGTPPAGTESAEASAEPAAGKWRPARTPAARSAASETAGTDPRAAEALMAMPYLQGYRSAEGRRGMVRQPRPDAVQPGLNLYVSGHAPEAVLMDSDGRPLHRWRYPLERVRPELYEGPEAESIRKLEYFRRARLLPDGDLLAIYEGLGLVRLTPASELVWAYRGGAHHDLDVAADGSIWTLDREGRTIPRIDPDHGILEDRVTVLSPDTGEPLRSISLLEAFERSDYRSLLARMAPPPDPLHTNTLEILDGRLAGRHPAFRDGNVLISVLELDTVAVLDPEAEEIVWALAGLWRKQHQPTIVGDGRMLVFDNLGGEDGGSRVLELDPFTQRIVWRYGRDLFSKTLGSVQRLANGNTLITESENGRAIEVDPEGEVVWEFSTPHRAGENDELVAVLFEVERLAEDFPFPPDQVERRRSR